MFISLTNEHEHKISFGKCLLFVFVCSPICSIIIIIYLPRVKAYVETTRKLGPLLNPLANIFLLFLR
ncbi:hypothetical protein Hanom_Chr06g00490701 [Helianthus anomalus]